MANYAFQNYESERMARAYGNQLRISTKHAVEICSHLRDKDLGTAKNELQQVVKKKRAIPFKRYVHDVAHRKGMRTGRYPIKASKQILQLLDSVEKNAIDKGFEPEDLKIVHICAHKAATPLRGGRHRGRQMKNTHVEVVVEKKSAEQ